VINFNEITIIFVSGAEAESLANPFYEEHAGKKLARKSDLFFLALHNKIVIGAVRLCFEFNIPVLRSMMIDPKYRRQRIGFRLLSEFNKYLDENDIKDTYCLPYAHLELFYQSIGFRLIPAIRKRQLPDFLKTRLREAISSRLKMLLLEKSYEP
jgi:N-acetylglutamate synthase-like GNAT family acetyltransferase